MKSSAQIAGLLLLLAMLMPPFVDARGSGSSGHSSRNHSSHSTSKSNTGYSSRSTHSGSHAKAAGVPRDSKGRIARSSIARNDFRKTHQCPSTGKSAGACPGYVVDHVTPLKRGGADNPSNMQWQTKEAAKIKDRTE